tara:strand:- start:1057 stop:1221 length:165 start_codon:yes stop_codon:yes gene_type:complete
MDCVTRKYVAVQEAKKKAKDPEFKKLWENVLIQLLDNNGKKVDEKETCKVGHHT